MFYFNKNIGGFVRKKIWEKIKVDRKIIEYFLAGKSATEIQKTFQKGKGYILSVRDKAVEYNYIEEIIPGEKKYKPRRCHFSSFSGLHYTFLCADTCIKLTGQYLI
jgi:hypothetical protein